MTGDVVLSIKSLIGRLPFLILCAVCVSVCAQDSTELNTVKETAKPAEPAAKEGTEASSGGLEIPFEIRPYAVRVEIGFHDGCLNSLEAQDVFLKNVQDAINRMYGNVWNSVVERNGWVFPETGAHLKRLRLADFEKRYPEAQVQKVFLLTLEMKGAGYRLSCREYDSHIRELTPVHEELTYDVRALPVIAARLMRDTFRPKVLFLRNEDNNEGRPLMELRIQAGAIKCPDPSAEQVVAGDVLRVFTRQMERRDPNTVKRLLAYPLSYVRVLGVDVEGPAAASEFGDDIRVEGEEPVAISDVMESQRGLVSGIYLTHLRTSLFGTKGRRMQHIAVRQRPAAQQSRVRIVLNGPAAKPLVSHRLSIAYQLFWKDKEDAPQDQLVTDRNGEVIIPARENHSTLWIRVYSGKSLLARVPYAPGLLPYDVVELPDDSVRLAVEGEVKLLADELIDAIAMREVLIVRATASAAENDAVQVKKLLDEFDAVPGKKQFLEKISNVRVTALKDAASRRVGTRGIKQLCSGLERTVTRFFSDKKREERQLQLEQLQLVVDAAEPAEEE